MIVRKSRAVSADPPKNPAADLIVVFPFIETILFLPRTLITMRIVTVFELVQRRIM